MYKTYKGLFKPKNPLKYKGDVNLIIYRSLLERKVMNWFDTHDSVVSWSSEEVKIPYISPIDQKRHTYFVDFYVKFMDSQSNIKEALIEVKPDKQTRPPQIKKNKTKYFKQECKTYLINEAKWSAARNFCENHGWEWKIWTEKNI